MSFILYLDTPRQVGHLERRLLEAAKLGFTKMICPVAPAGPAAASFEKARVRLAGKGMQLLPCKTVLDAIQTALGSKLRKPSTKRSSKATSDDEDQ